MTLAAATTKGTRPFANMKGRVPFVIALISLVAAPAALACDPALEAQIAAQPENTDTRDALARSCARAGEHAAALEQYGLFWRGHTGEFRLGFDKLGHDELRKRIVARHPIDHGRRRSDRRQPALTAG